MANSYIGRAIGLLSVAAAFLASSEAAASPIDDPGANCRFEFDQNTDIPFLDFQSGKTATNIPNNYYFTQDTLSDGTMDIFDGSNMTDVPTNLTIGGNVINVRLQFIDLVGTTDLSAGVAIDWTITARMYFTNTTLGMTTANCKTGTFDIDVAGDWGAITSSGFTIPSLSGTGTGACNAQASGVNTGLGLGSSGATLTLYKFSAYESNGTTHLHGS